MTNEDAILDVLVPCNSEGEQLTYPKCLDNLSCFPSLVTSAAGPKLYFYLSFDFFRQCMDIVD